MGDIIGRGRGVALAAVVVAAGLTLLILIPYFGGGILPGYAFALVYGVGIGAMSACYSALAGDCFGGRTYGVIIGFMEICYGLGGVVGPLFAGFMYDYTTKLLHSLPDHHLLHVLLDSPGALAARIHAETRPGAEGIIAAFAVHISYIIALLPFINPQHTRLDIYNNFMYTSSGRVHEVIV